MMNTAQATIISTSKCNLRIYYFLGFIFVAACFAWLDQFSISVGDDFGYMFTDSSLHAGDGHRVITISDCLNTQFSHYQTTNGRFIVHLLTQIYLNLLPSWCYRLCNAIMFGTLWLFIVKIINPKTIKDAISIMSITVLLLFIATPRTGMIILSLTAFSLNYLWSGALNLIFIYIFISHWPSKQKSVGIYILLSLTSLFVGSLHESYSLPISGALTLYLLLNRTSLRLKSIILYVGYLIGTSICVFAPGNLSHAAQSGGINMINIGHKVLVTLEDLPSTPIPYVLLLIFFSYIIKRDKTKKFIFKNIILLSAVAMSLFLCFITYTSFRQLFAPSVFSILIIILWFECFTNIFNRFFKLIASVSISATLCITYYAGELRRQVYENHNSFIKDFSEMLPNSEYSNDFVIVDVLNSPYHTSPVLWKLFGRYAPDPWERSAFTLPFDSYSKQGMNRLYRDPANIKEINTLLPFRPSFLKNRFQTPASKNVEGFYNVTPVDNRYGIICVSQNVISSSSPTIYIINRFGESATTPYEKFTAGDKTYFIFPHTVTQVSLNGNN